MRIIIIDNHSHYELYFKLNILIYYKEPYE